jgi:XTP/dITP diphosphohydrolase
LKSFLLASGNAHKAEEFKELFLDGIEIQAAPRTLEVQETGKTFIENALIKAKAYAEIYKVPTLADDSGLVIEALPQILGVESARFAPELPLYSDKCQKLIEMMSGLSGDQRKAYFVCILCFYIAEEEYYFFEGRVQGVIAHEQKGDKGFGYDPVFIPERSVVDGKSLAELPDWKNEFSHRARAVKSSLEFFKESMDKTHQKS